MAVKSPHSLHQKNTNSWGHAPPREAHILHFCMRGRAGPTVCPQLRIGAEPYSSQLPSLSPGLAPPLSEAGRGTAAEAWRGGVGGGGGWVARSLRAEAGARAFLCGSWHLQDWFRWCCRRSGRSQLGARGAQSHPGAAADGAHLAADRRVLGSLRRAELLGGCSSQALGSGPISALSAPRILATVSLEATSSEPPAPFHPTLPPPRPIPRPSGLLSRPLVPGAPRPWASEGCFELPCSCCSSGPGLRRATTPVLPRNSTLSSPPLCPKSS